MKRAQSDVLTIVIHHGHGDLVTDPNGFAVMAMIPKEIASLLKPMPTAQSDISGGPAVTYVDYDGTACLTPSELMRLAGLRLRPNEYKALVAKHGMRHQWHEDFYDPDTGAALQPRPPI